MENISGVAMDKQNRFHACSTCEHFSAKKSRGKMIYRCKRLDYETRPQYAFNCWNPKDHVRKLIIKEMQTEKLEE